MTPLDPMAVALITAEVVASPLHIGAVLILAAPPDAGPGYVDELYRQLLVADDPVDPRLCRYPHRGPDTGGIWVWRSAGAPQISHYCRRHTVSGGFAGLWALIGELDAQRLDRSRPMWMSYLIDGFDPGRSGSRSAGRFAFYIKAHHTLLDGVAGMQMITDALSADPQRRSMPAFYAARRESKPPPAPEGGRVRRLTAPLRSLTGAATAGIGLAERVVTGQARTVVDSLIGNTTVLPFAAPYTRFNSRLGRARVVAAGSWPKDRIRAVQRAAGVSGNDVVTAMAAGVLRNWLRDRGELPGRSLVAICPMTVRDRADVMANHMRGNRFGTWLCPLGTDLDDPAARLDLIHRSLSEGKNWIAQRGSAASVLTAAPSIAATVLLPLAPFTPKIRTGYNVPISHVAGPRCEMYWNGAHVEAIYPVSAVYDGHALNLTTCSYADRVGFGYVADRDAVPDIDALLELTESSLSELEAAVGSAASG